ncbi:Acyl-CoA dehydrogenase [Shimia gijangensis]|uniref:Acyl-CoA dehydrogenase n=1 Tax=Shimia gijangensis TaxID=1470563 RepID=A0A1M6T6V2_9RHOB|nr:acyl-CoA dehydrogenase [Shimia gijangensis]SHK52616.1 Acyl-CoA dehydrogenase [Shimia gijangensis]
MPATLLSTRDLDFLLYDWIGLESRLNESGLMDRESADAYFDLSRKLAEDEFLTHYKASDTKEPWMDADGVHVLPEIGKALTSYKELGLFGASFSEDLGGMGLPFLVTSASFVWFVAANCATVGYAMLTGANARLIASFGSAEQVEQFALPQIAGDWFGTMCLSEPQAGSGLGDVRTRAVADGQDALGDRYRLQGNKMWISAGDHDISENIVHLVLAKVPDENGVLPEGTKGISLFIVPKMLPDGNRNDVIAAGLNHKMGNRGTSNCLLNFGENDGAVGWMIGESGQGLRQMFMMMNEARIAVGFTGAAQAYRGYLLAVDYARERLQGRHIGQRGGDPVPIIEHADVKRMLVAAKSYAEGSMALCLFCAALVDRPEDSEASALLELLTPVAKTFPSEFGLAANDLAIQVHGGYGYTRDFDVEQLYRDNRLNAIHEGTTGIQAQDLLARKILHSDGAGISALKARVTDTIRRARHLPKLVELADDMQSALDKVDSTIEALKGCNPQAQIDNATPFFKGFCVVVVAWHWLDQALCAANKNCASEDDRNFVQGKLAACRYFFECELTSVTPMLTFVASGSDAVSSISPDFF